jgi:hypothetical protein
MTFMKPYEEIAWEELKIWQKKMQQSPSLMNKMSRRLQGKINSYIPEKVHNAITTAIKQMVRAVLFGAEMTTREPMVARTLEIREAVVQEKIRFYKNTAAAEGGITGAGGLLLGLADFPLFFGIKMKMLFEIAACYGHRVEDYRERLFLLHIFHLTFSNQDKRKAIYLRMVNWEETCRSLPADIHQFNWRDFQQEYRDYLDIAKLLQLVPVIGAPVGFVVNYRLILKLGKTAMNAYRMRWFNDQKKISVPR